MFFFLLFLFLFLLLCLFILPFLLPILVFFSQLTLSPLPLGPILPGHTKVKEESSSRLHPPTPPALLRKPRAVFRVLRGRRPGIFRTEPLLAEVPGPGHCDRILMYLTYNQEQGIPAMGPDGRGCSDSGELESLGHPPALVRGRTGVWDSSFLWRKRGREGVALLSLGSVGLPCVQLFHWPLQSA